jgi:uncharacterized protein (TIGR02117 family)
MRRRIYVVLSIGIIVLVLSTVIPFRHLGTGRRDAPRAMRIALIDHGYHIGIVVPVRTAWYDLGTEFGLQGHGDVVEIGWGDRSFYMNSGFDLGKAASALFGGSGGSVMHLWRRGVDTTNDVRYDITAEDLQVMVAAIRATAQRTADDAPMVLDEGYDGARSAFVAAHGSYSVLSTCNQWTSDLLLLAGFAMPLWCPMPENVLWPMEWQR